MPYGPSILTSRGLRVEGVLDHDPLIKNSALLGKFAVPDRLWTETDCLVNRLVNRPEELIDPDFLPSPQENRLIALDLVTPVRVTDFEDREVIHYMRTEGFCYALDVKGVKPEDVAFYNETRKVKL